jgi:membrane protein implicated in regulation of membrane protease activity
MVRLLSSHETIGGLVYSWGSFQIGRMYHGTGKPRGAFLWSILGIIAALIYLVVGFVVGQWVGAIFLTVSLALEVMLVRRWFSSPPQPPHV